MSILTTYAEPTAVLTCDYCGRPVEVALEDIGKDGACVCEYCTLTEVV